MREKSVLWKPRLTEYQGMSDMRQLITRPRVSLGNSVGYCCKCVSESPLGSVEGDVISGEISFEFS